MTKCINILIKFFLNTNAVFVKVIIQRCLPVMVEKWKEVLDKGGLGGALLTDLSKAFDCIKHDLLIAKLAAYGFDSHSLSFVFSYFNERKQRTKMHNSYSPYAHIAREVPPGSILGPLLFSINMCDMFFEKYECELPATLMIIHLTHMTQIHTLS